MRYIAICNWSTYQHYKDRNPPWIKLHRELMTSRTWVGCGDTDRVLAIALMMLAAATGNKIPYDAGYIKRVCYLNSEPDLTLLLAVQFIEIIDETGKPHTDASKPCGMLDQRRVEERQSRGRGETDQTVGAEVPEDSDKFIENLITLHPRSVKSAETEQAIVGALIRESSIRGGDEQAMAYLLDRTRLYRELTDGWPPGKVSKICGAVSWYANSKYSENEKFWKAEDGNYDKQSESKTNIVSAIERRNAMEARGED